MYKLILTLSIAVNMSLGAQQATLCPCKNVWVTLAPDSSVIHLNLPARRINTSYILWNQFVALGQKDGYPEDDTLSDYPGNFHTYDFGCPNSIVYDKKPHTRYTGELVFTYDEIDRGRKDIILQRTQIVDGLKDGYEIFFGVDEERGCYYPKILAFFKKGLIYRKVYAFEYVDKRLLVRLMESYNDEGRLYGETKVFDNGLVFLKNGKSLQNIERIEYEAFIIRHPSSDCTNVGQELFGNGISTEYSVSDERVAFDGRRVQYDPDNGQLRWEEQWQNGQLQLRKSYYVDPPECPRKPSLLMENKTFTYLENGEFREETVEYFPDCFSSVKEKYSTLNHYPRVGSSELFSAPGKIKERGFFNDEGEKSGVWEFYNNEGVLERRTTFKNNVEDGIEEVFDEKGSLFRKVRYLEGRVVEIIK